MKFTPEDFKKESTTSQVILRPATKDDRSYIFSSWLHSQYWSNPYFQKMPQDLFFKEYTNHITNLLVPVRRTEIHVACLDSEPSMILGYLVFDPDTVHWTYVKRDYRSKGILNLMLKDKEFKYFTGSTPAGHDIASKLKLTFNPFMS